MRGIKVVSRQEYDEEIEGKIQKMTKYAYITQKTWQKSLAAAVRL